jgi:nicotinamide-nucleotide amidase
MRCEVVAIGTELLLGQIVDTNSSWIGEQLALAGIDCYRQVKVGDNQPRIVEALREALDRADAVICCGGLGPTQDDLTRYAIAEVMGVELDLDDTLADRIAMMFSSRGRDMPANNYRQAEVPRGAWAMDQMPGTAAGLVCPVTWAGADGPVDKVIYAVPGVPSEMHDMVAGTVVPDLRRRSGESAAVIASRTVRTWGWSESHLAEVLAPLLDDLDRTGEATVAFLASGWEGLKVRVTAKGATDDEVAAVLDTQVARVADAVGDQVFSTHDEPMEQVVLDALAARGLTVAVAESLTGGLVAARLTSRPGASAVVRGAVVSYASEVKFDLLGVAEGPVVTEEAASAMAAGVARRLGADVGVATTGVAGPDSAEGVRPGTVCLATWVDGETQAITVRFPGGRDQVRQFAVISVLDMLRRQLAARPAG